MTPFAPGLAGFGVLLCAPAAVGRARLGALAGSGRLAQAPVRRPFVSAGRLPRRGSWTWLAVVAVAVFVGLVCGALAVAIEVVAGLAVSLTRDVRRARRAERRSARIVESIRLISGELSAGTPLPDALAAAAELVPEHAGALRHAAAEARTAGDPARPLLATGDGVLAGAGHAVRVAARCGAPVSVVLARVESDVEARRRRRRELATAIAGPRASCVLLAVLPLLGVGLGGLMGAHPTAFLFGSHAGRLLTCGAVLLDAIGVLWARRIVHQAVPP